MNKVLIVNRHTPHFSDISRYIKSFKPLYFDIYDIKEGERVSRSFSYISNYLFNRGMLDDDEGDDYDYKYHNFLISNLKLFSYRKRKDYINRKKYYLSKAYRSGYAQNNSNNNIFTRSIIRNNNYNYFIKEKVFG